MDKRDMEDITMQARENINSVLDDEKKKQDEQTIKVALGKLWSELPQEFKDKMSEENPDMVEQMNKEYGKVEPQGNPWGVFDSKKGR